MSCVLVLCLILQAVVFPDIAYQATKQEERKTYLIGLKKENELEDFISRLDIKVDEVKELTHLDIGILKLRPSDASKIKQDTEVLFLEEDASISIISSTNHVSKKSSKTKKRSSQVTPWGIQQIMGAPILSHEEFGKNIKIAVLDTGIATHQDLEVESGVSFVEGVSSYIDDNGHGTQVAGIIAAQNNDFGVVGVAPKSKIYAVKVMDHEGQGTYSQLLEGINWSIEKKINIISMSLGGKFNSEALQQAVKKATERGAILIAAAGNGEDLTEVYPSQYPEVVSVGATDQSREHINYSKSTKIDLIAPGIDIFTTSADGEYEDITGSSAAVPHVAGVAAVIWAQDRKLAGEKVKKMLFDSATKGQEYRFLRLPLSQGEGQENSAQEISSFQEWDKQIKKYNDIVIMLGQIAWQNEQKQQLHSIKKNLEDLHVIYTELRKLPPELQFVPMDKKLKKNQQAKIEKYFRSKKDELIEHQKKYHSLIKNSIDSIAKHTSDKKKNINSSTSGSDTFEPNDDPSQAYSIKHADLLQSYISVKEDVDYYTFTADVSGEINILLNLPPNQDYDIEVRDQQGTLIAIGDSPSRGSYEYLQNISVLANTTYYLKVFPKEDYFGYFDPNNPYNMVVTPIRISVDTLVDISLPDGEEKIYGFTSPSTAMYSIYTGPYGESGPENDTIIEFFEDLSLTEPMSVNDNNNGTTFSEVTPILEVGRIYLAKIKPASGGALHTRFGITLKKHALILSPNGTIDINLNSEDQPAIGFIKPEYSGEYTFSATLSQDSEPIIEVYRDANLTDLIGRTEEEKENVTASLLEGFPVYLTIRHPDSGEHLTTQLTAKLESITITDLDSPQYIDVGPEQKPIVFTFTPQNSGDYRLYTGSYSDGQECDTDLQIYEDKSMSSPLAENDNTGSSTFSEINVSLSADKAYYIKLNSNPSDERLTTRFMIDNKSNSAVQATYTYSYNTKHQLEYILENGVEIMQFIYDDNGNLKEKIKK